MAYNLKQQIQEASKKCVWGGGEAAENKLKVSLVLSYCDPITVRDKNNVFCTVIIIREDWGKCHTCRPHIKIQNNEQFYVHFIGK